MATIQQFLDALTAHMAANPPQAPAAVPFALFPGAVNQGVLNFNKSEIAKLFYKAVTPVDPQYDLQEHLLRTFLEQVLERARLNNWDDLLMVPDAATTPRNIITHFGMLKIEDCVTHALTYTGVVDSRLAHNNMMMYQFLSNSISEAGMALMIPDKDVYFVRPKQPSAICFLKILIGKASVDTNAKVSLLRKRVAKLGDMMHDEFKGDVRKFNVYASECRDQLVGRGHSVDELLTFLFDAYRNGVPDEEFHRYIEMQQNKYDDGAIINAEELMRLAVTKFDTIMQRKEMAGEGEKKIMALKAEQVYELTETYESNYAQKREAYVVPEMMKIPPGPNEPKSKEFKVKNKAGKERMQLYHWCPKHVRWTVHTPKECTLSNTTTKKAKAKPDEKKGDHDKDDPQLSLN